MDEDSIKASPVTNDYALALSKVLKGAKGLANKVDAPVLGPLGDFLLGQAPEEVENWAYGNSPVAVPPMSNVPIVKTGRKQGLADAVGLAPVGGPVGVGADNAALWASKLARQDLALYHKTHPLKSNVKELTSPSFAITPNSKGIIEGFGSDILIPRPQKLEPRTNPTVIKNRDFWSPTRTMAKEAGLGTDKYLNPKDVLGYDEYQKLREELTLKKYDELMKSGEYSQPGSGKNPWALNFATDLADTELWSRFPNPKYLSEKAKARLHDRFYPEFPKGAAFSSGTSSGSWPSATATSPRFQSFKHFEQDPRGAALLDKEGVPREYTRKFSEVLKKLGAGGVEYEWGGSSIPLGGMDSLAVPDKDSILSFGKLFDADNIQKRMTYSGEPMDRENAIDMANFLRKHRKENFDFSPSKYAEVKRFGPMPITGDNFGYYLTRDPDLTRETRDSLRSRGIDTIPLSDDWTPKDINILISELQSTLLKRK